MRLVLPWPPHILTPNARPADWKFRQAKRVYHNLCHGLALEAGLHLHVWPQDIPVRITFCDPTGRVRRDDDNAKAAFKHGRDGVARAMRVDDARWKPDYAEGNQVSGGAVMLEFLAVIVPVWGVVR